MKMCYSMHATVEKYAPHLYFKSIFKCLLFNTDHLNEYLEQIHSCLKDSWTG